MEIHLFCYLCHRKFGLFQQFFEWNEGVGVDDGCGTLAGDAPNGVGEEFRGHADSRSVVAHLALSAGDAAFEQIVKPFDGASAAIGGGVLGSTKGKHIVDENATEGGDHLLLVR